MSCRRVRPRVSSAASLSVYTHHTVLRDLYGYPCPTGLCHEVSTLRLNHRTAGSNRALSRAQAAGVAEVESQSAEP